MCVCFLKINMFLPLYDFRRGFIRLFRMSNLLKEFKSEIHKLELSKTERYWLEQVNFEIESLKTSRTELLVLISLDGIG